MEQALGKSVIDAAFRDAFFRDPVAVLATRIELTTEERSAPVRIRPGAL